MTPEKIWECFLLCLTAIIAALIITVALSHVSFAHDYQHPDQDDWYVSLMQPDQPTISCCDGRHDAYFADRTEACTAADVPVYGSECAIVAIITDDRVIEGRPPVPSGTRVPIPKNKIRKHVKQPNPTEHNIVFMSQARFVYCWEPLPLT